MIERDFIMRIVREAAQMLARVVSKRAEGLFEEARKELDGVCRREVGLELDFARSIAPDDLLGVLKEGGVLYLGRCVTLAEILLEDARIREESGRGMETVPNYVHALVLLREASQAVDDAAREEIERKIAAVAARLGELGLGDFAAAKRS